MKKIYRYVFKLFVSPLLATFFVSLFVLLMQFLWRYIGDIVGKGLEWQTLAEFFTYSTLTLVPMALPLAILLASLMTFGSLGERLELLSIKAAGVSLFKVMRPLIIFVVALSIGAFFFANNVLPHSMSQLRALMHEIQHQRPELSLKEKVFDYSMKDMTIKIGSKAPDGSMLYDVMIFNHSDRSDQGSVTVADSGTIIFSPDRTYSTITLYHGQSYSIVKEDKKRYDTKKVPYRRDKFAKQVVIFENTEDYKRPDAEIYGNHRTSQNLAQLNESVAENDSIFNHKQEGITRQLTQLTYLGTRSFEKQDSTYTAQELDLDSLFLHTKYSTQTLILAKAKDQATKIKNTLEPKRKDIKNRRLTLKQYMSERHRRFTLSIACLVFFFIGAPLGAIIRKGGFGMPVVVSIIFLVFYYIIDTFGYKFATESFTPIWFGMWLSSIILLLTGGFLTWKAATDSVIMDSEVYKKFFKKINIFKKNNDAE
jgi:lipopolysaccharide export system permease protein